MIKISPSSLHERHDCLRCVWNKFHHNWTWPWSAGLYPRFSALEEKYTPTQDAGEVLNDFMDGAITDAEWLPSKGNLQCQPIEGVDSHGRGDVFIGGEFDLAAKYTKDGVERVAVIDCKTTGKKTLPNLKKWANKNDKEADYDVYNADYSLKYLPQLASYAYCMENPATAEQIAHYKAGEEQCWPPTKPKYRRIPKDPDKPIAHKVGTVGILMFNVESNIERHEDRFHFTCETKWVEVPTGGRTWGEIITPIAQKLCDIVALPEMPEASDKCGSCNDAAEYNDLVSA